MSSRHNGHDLSALDLTRIEEIYKRYVKPSGVSASVSATLAILALYTIALIWLADKTISQQKEQIASFVESQEKRLTAYEESSGKIAGNLEDLRKENLTQIGLFSDKFGVVSTRLDGMNQTLLESIRFQGRETRRGCLREEKSLESQPSVRNLSPLYLLPEGAEPGLIELEKGPFERGKRS